MNTPVESRPQSVDRPVQGADAAAATRRRLLRMVAGGAPLLAGPDAIAHALPMSSAYRAARNDAKEHPALISAREDRWIRQPVEIVLVIEKRKRDDKDAKDDRDHDDRSSAPRGASSLPVSLGDAGGLAGLASIDTSGLWGRRRFLAYKVLAHGVPRFYRCDDFSPFRPTGEHDVVSTRMTVWMLALFDRQSFQLLPEVVDPHQYKTARHRYQGLRCSSWASINPNGGRPLSCGV